jgi:hypothetical protein
MTSHGHIVRLASPEPVQDVLKPQSTGRESRTLLPLRPKVKASVPFLPSSSFRLGAADLPYPDVGASAERASWIVTTATRSVASS